MQELLTVRVSRLQSALNLKCCVTHISHHLSLDLMGCVPPPPPEQPVVSQEVDTWSLLYLSPRWAAVSGVWGQRRDQRNPLPAARHESGGLNRV